MNKIAYAIVASTGLVVQCLANNAGADIMGSAFAMWFAMATLLSENKSK